MLVRECQAGQRIQVADPQTGEVRPAAVSWVSRNGTPFVRLYIAWGNCEVETHPIPLDADAVVVS